MVMMKGILVVVVLLALYQGAVCLNNGLARRPQMGWNSWNKYGCSVTEQIVVNNALALVRTGLRDVGYNYLNVDDCWAYSRTSKGEIVADPKTFPKGMKYLADFAHSLGLRFGLYSDAGTQTCDQRPGSLGHETSDAKTYASWGVDYLKYDNCYDNGIPPQTRYPVMRDALNQTGRPILFSMCEWGVDNPATWAPAVGNSWRTTADIKDTWESMLYNLNLNNEVAQYAGPGGWNDPDMLEVGNGGMNYSEYVAHFSLWALVKAPLLIGTDLTTISAKNLAILTNQEVIAINQDPLGVQGRRVQGNKASLTEVWAVPLSDHSVGVVLLNKDTQGSLVTAEWSSVGLPPNTPCKVRDLWARKYIPGVWSTRYIASVPAHGVVFLRLFPQK